MKKNYTLPVFIFLLIGGKSFSQTFSFTPLDTIKYGAPNAGTELICSATLINNTTNTILTDVVRVQNVIPDAPDWTSAFCMDVCYLPTTDSVRYTFLPMTTVNFTFHIYISATPDSAAGIMKFKNVATSSNTFYQRFHGVTQSGLGVNENLSASPSVSIYPMPIVSGNVFTMNISNVKQGKEISLWVYDMFGRVVSSSNVISGINFMNLDLPAGVYSYNLISGSSKVNSGKIAVSR